MPEKRIARLTPFLVTAALFSIITNLLMLVSPLYMLQVYDRVLTSGSVETLVLVSILAAGLLGVFIIADTARRKALALGAHYLQTHRAPKIFKADIEGYGKSKSLQKDLTDLSTVQGFLSQGMILPIFDLPFTPFFLMIMFLIHPLIGWIGVLGGLLLLGIALLTELTTRKTMADAQKAESAASMTVASISRQQAAIISMGMSSVALRNWQERKSVAGDLSLKGANATGFFGSTTRGLRLLLQIAALGAGAFLVLQQEATAGVIIAGSILLGRALAPIDQAVGMWRQIMRAHSAWKDLHAREKEISDLVDDSDQMAVPRPDPKLEFTALEIAAGGDDRPLLPKFNLTLNQGDIVALVGASGSGKTSLLQTAAGAWKPFSGQVRLGGRDLHSWGIDDRGKYIGYLPQDVDLLDGTVAQNICRFNQDATSEEIVELTRRIGCHTMIMSLKEGYDTRVGPEGVHISAGQRQAIGLARAAFGNPVMLLLDEPSSNLDQVLAQSVRTFLSSLKAQGTIIIVSTHDLRLVETADSVIVLTPDRIAMMPKTDYFAALRKQGPALVQKREGTNA